MKAVYLPIRGIIWGVLRRVLQFRFGLVKSGSFEVLGVGGEGEGGERWEAQPALLAARWGA